MAKKRYKNILPVDPNVALQIRVGVDDDLGLPGAGPGEDFEFDYDRPGYDEQMLIDAGMIRIIESKSKKEA